MRNYLRTAIMCLAAMVAGAPAFAGCGKITMTEMNWASSQIVTSTANFILEEAYGCDVRLVPSSTVPALASVAETGEPDVLTELWVNGTPAYERLVERGGVIPLANVLTDGGIEGWWVPDYLVAEHPELGTLEGILANPQAVGGRFHQCPAGWGCQRANDAKVTAFGLREAGIEIFQHGSGETLAASIAAAFEDHAPWFGYYWGPTAILGKYPMVRIDLGGVDDKVHACDQDPDCPDRGQGRSDYPPSPVLTVVTADLAAREPEAAAFLSRFSFDNATMNGLLAWQEDNAATAEETAAHLLATRPDLLRSWLDDAGRENLAGLLD